MRSYSGWGGAADAFRDDRWLEGHPEWRDVNRRIRATMTDEEYARAEESVLTAYYTPAGVTDAIWSSLAEHGIGRGGDSVLDPSCGTGNLMVSAPPGTRLFGIDLEPTSAAMAKALTPDADVHAAAYEGCRVPEGSMDAVVTNAPFSNDIKVDYGGHPLSLHNFFMLRAIDDVRPGGVVAMVTSRWLMDAQDGRVRRAMAQKAELLAAVRLPQETFQRQAGTDAITDVLVLRKRGTPVARADADIASAYPWVETDVAFEIAGADPVRMNKAFLAGGLGSIVGTPGVQSGPFGPRLSVSCEGTDDIGTQLAAALGEQLDHAVGHGADLHDGMGPRTSEPSVAVIPTHAAVGEYTVADDGSVWLRDGGTCRELDFTDGERNRMAGMIAIRNAYVTARETQLDPSATDEQAQSAIATLRGTYDGFVAKYGHLNDAENSSLYLREPTGWATKLLGLEETDAHGRFSAVSTALERRVFWPEPPRPTRVSTPQEALAVSLDQTGGIDEALVACLLGIEEGDVEHALGSLAVRDPMRGSLVEATQYLSGNLGTKVDAVRSILHDLERAPMRDAEYAWHDEVGLSGHIASMLADEGFRDVLAELDRSPTESRAGSVCWRTMSDPRGTDAACLPWREYSRATSYGTGSYGPYTRLATPLLAAWARSLSEGALDGSFVREKDGTIRRETDRLEHRLDLPLSCAVAAYARDGSLVTGSLSDRGPGSLHPTALNLWILASSRGVPGEAIEWVLQRCESQGALGHASAKRRVPIADAVRRLLDMPEDASLSDVAHAMRERPEVLEYLATKSIEWEQTPDSQKGPLLKSWGQRVEQRRSFSHRTGRSETWWALDERQRADGGLEERWSDRSGFERFSARREERISAALAAIDLDAVDAVRHVLRRLEAALPAELTPSEIATSPNSPWVSPTDVLEFCRDEMLSGVPASSTGRLVVARINGTWTCETAGVKVSPEAQAKWGIVGTPTPTRPDGEAKSPLWLLQRVLAGVGIDIQMDHPEGKRDDKGKVLRVKDVKATLAAWEAKERLETRFAEWVHADPARESRLARTYNRLLNRMRPARFDGSYLTLPDKTADIDLRPWQRDAVSRVLRSDHGTLLAHVVGAGKTMACVATMHEAKRLGRCTKPMVAVPNHLVGNWASEWSRLYPNDRLLVMDDQAVSTPDAERRFWGAVANGDWDGIVVRQSRLDMMHLSEEAMAGLIDARMSEFKVAEDTGDYRSFKRQKAAEARVRLQVERVTKLTAQEVKHDQKVGITLDQTGIDFVCVDESHAYKNLRPATAMNVAGITSQSSRKAERMLQLCQWMQGRGLGGNILFASGTPVTNSMAELYTQFRFLAPEVLLSQGIRSFDDWAASHGRVVAAAEPKVEGGFQVKERFSKFVNVPELMCAAHTMMDLVTHEDIDLDLPHVEEVQVAVDMTKAQRVGMEWLAQRGDAIRAGGVDPSVDNMLAITADGQKLSLDPKLLFADDPDVPDMGGAGKIGECARRVAELHGRYAEERGCQAVFCDSSTDASKGRWNALDALKAQLVRLGVPANEIVSVNDVGSDPDKRQALFERVRSGEVRILLGSTTTAGTGANIQDRLIAVHHLDVPWTPAAMEQRRGRIERQGNRFGHAYEYRYVTVGSFDSFLLDAVTRKASFVSQIMRNEVTTREVEDLSQVVLGYEELRLLATGDPVVQQRLTLQNHVDQLTFAKASFEGQRRDLLRKVEAVHEPAIKALSPIVGNMRADAPSIHAAADVSRCGTSPWPGLTTGGTHTDERRAANEALNRSALAVAPGSEEKVGAYLGLDVMAKADVRPIDLSGGTTIVRSLGVRGPSGTTYWNPNAIGTGAVTQLDNVLREGFDKAMARAEGELDQHRRAIDAIREATTRKWDGEAELREAKAELEALPPDTGETRKATQAVTRADVRKAAGEGATRDEVTASPPRLSDATRECAEASRAMTPQPTSPATKEHVA